jgi:diguanylate cyclase (GGDEF)-like protein
VFANVHPDDLPRVLEFGAAVLDSQPGWQGTIPARLHHADGSWRNFEIHVVNHLEDPRIHGVIVRTRELPGTGPIVMVADSLDFSGDAMIESIAEVVPMALLVLGSTGRLEFANRTARQLCDLPATPEPGWHLAGWAMPEDEPRLTEMLGGLGTQTGSRMVRFSVAPRRAGEDPRQIEARFVARGMDGRPSAIIAILEDVTVRCLEEAELRRRATIDPLTGVLNRSAVLEEIEARLQRGPLTAIYCDLDGFKSVNDTLGHATGDEVLVGVAGVLASLVRPTDLVGRVGGDEFVIVCEGLTTRPTKRLLTRLEAAFNGGLGVVISMGVASAEAGASAADLIARADQAMYDAKRRAARGSAG